MTTGKDDKSGAKLNALIADIDFSDVPEAIRDEVIAKVTDKVKFYDGGYRAKTEILSEEKKKIETDRKALSALLEIQNELKGNPAMEKAVIAVINDFRAGKTNSGVNIDKSMKRLDKLIENATDSDVREQLKEMRQIVAEETDTPALKGKIRELEEKINRIENSSNSNHAKNVEVELDSLEKEFGKDLVGKYREDIKVSALKFPNQKVKKILYHFAEENEIEDAILKRAEEKKKKEIEFKKNGSLPNGSSMTTKVDVPRDNKGRVNWRGFIGNLKSAGRFN